MNQPLAILAVALGGAAGSVARYLVNLAFVARLGSGFPWATFTINVTGSFLIGVVMQIAASRLGMSPYVRVLLATGVLGGFTTFSSFSFEALTLGSGGAIMASVLYVVGSVVLGVLAAFGGVVVVRLLVAP